MNEPTQIQGFEHLGEFLKANGYTVTPPETSKEETKETEKTTENETKNDEKQETKQEQKSEETTKETQPNNVIFQLLGTPNQNSENTELTEEKIMVMTPEQIQKNMPKIREHILANGGKF